MLRMSSAFDLDTDIITSSEQWLLPHINVPKTSSGAFMNPHITPQRMVEEGIVKPEIFEQYECYAFLRDVHSRFVSAYAHDKGPKARQPSTFLKYADQKKILKGILGRPQVEYFFLDGVQVVRPLDFSKYEESLRHLIYRVQGFPFKEIPKINVTGLTGRHDGVKLKERVAWAEKIWDFEPVREYILEEYADDHAFWKESFA